MPARAIIKPPRLLAPVLRCLDLDPVGWERSIDRLIRAENWPILVALAKPRERPADRGVSRALGLLAVQKSARLRPWVLALRGRCRLYRNDERARGDLAAALRLDRGLTQARLWLAESYMSTPATLREAAELADKSVDAHPDSAWALTVRAACRGLDRRVEAALQDLELAAALDPRRPLIRVLRCEFLNLQFRSREAIAEAEIAARLQPRSVWAQLLWGRAIFNCGGDKTLGTAVVRKARAMSPDCVEARVMLAEALRRQGKFREALRQYAAVNEEGLSYPRMNAWRGALLRQMGRLRESLTDLDKAAEASPEYPLTFVERAHARLRLGEYERAFEDMNAAARLDSKHGWIFARPGEEDSLDEVLRFLRRAAAKLPRSPWPSAWLGDCRFRQGRLREAVRHFDDAVAVDPDCAWALAWRGEALARLGRPEAAAKDLRRAVQLDRGNARAHGRLGIVLGGLGKLREGLAALNESLRLDPRCAWALGHRGELKLLLGHAKDAVADLDHAINQHGEYADAYLWRGFALGLCGGDGTADISRAAALGKDRAALKSWIADAMERCRRAAVSFDAEP